MNKLIAFVALTAFWVLFGIFGFVLATRFKDRSVIQCCFIITAFCCWLLWLVTFLMQLNPLIGPKVNQRVVYGMVSYWENSHIREH